MSKTYKLKSWDNVDNHHSISKERWDALTTKVLKAEFLDGFLSTTALIYPNGEVPTLSNTFMVDKNDLRECVCKSHWDKPNEDTNKNSAPIKDTPKEKTYTKDDIRRAGERVMKDIEGEEEAIITALALGKLITELN